jgi:hypothetical protein
MIICGVLYNNIVLFSNNISVHGEVESVFLVNIINNSFSSDIKSVRVSSLINRVNSADFSNSESGSGLHHRALIAVRSANRVNLNGDSGNFIDFSRIFNISNKKYNFRVFNSVLVNINFKYSRLNNFGRDTNKSFIKVTSHFLIRSNERFILYNPFK